MENMIVALIAGVFSSAVTVFVSKKMSELLKISDEEIQKLTTKNAQKLFKEFSSLS